MKSHRNIFSLPPSRLLKGLIGRPLISLFPKRAREVRERPFRGEWGPLGRLIRNGYYLRAIAEEDHGLVHDFLRDYWASSASQGFFDHFQHRFETVFLKHHAGIVGEIARIADEWKDVSPRLVEIGVGDAKVLAHLESELPNFREFHGIDVNEEQIAINREKFGTVGKFQFWTEDAHHWLIRHPGRGTVIFTNGGVFEYLTRRQLRALFRELANVNCPCAVAVTETVALDHDLLKEKRSLSYGPEFAFSHNYPKVLEEAGFKVCWQQDRLTVEGEENHPERWCQFLAVAEGSNPSDPNKCPS